MHRTDTLVCLGGGVVGDVGGLAAALYMRGISCVQVGAGLSRLLGLVNLSNT